MLTLGEIQRVLQALLSEGVSIRDLGAIVEAVGDKARLTRDPSLLAEYARQALGRAITAPYLDDNRTLHAITLDPPSSRRSSPRSRRPPRASTWRWSPRARRRCSQRCAAVGSSVRARGGCARCCCARARVRRHLRRLVEQTLPHLAVCSYNEIAAGISVETIGVVST